jgi:hypothetical protein
VSCQLSAVSFQPEASSFQLNLFVITAFVIPCLSSPVCHSEPAVFAGEESAVVSIAGELGDDGIFPLLYPRFELHDSRHGGIRTRNLRLMK